MMWGRVIEIMTAVWLAASPFIFNVQADPVLLWADLTVALLICFLSGMSYWKPTRHAHVLILVVAAALMVWARFFTASVTPIHQNHIVVGLFLLMVALIPNYASQPPQRWQRVYS